MGATTGPLIGETTGPFIGATTGPDGTLPYGKWRGELADAGSEVTAADGEPRLA